MSEAEREREDIMSETATAPVKTENGKVHRPDPFEMFETFQDEMARLWGQTWPFGSWPLAHRTAQRTTGAALWTPRVDVFEKNGDIVVKAELPGAKKEDIEVTLDQGDLMIRGQKKAETEVKEEHYYRMEQSYGSFYRRLALPFETTAEQIEATYAEGILEIRIPKPATEAQPAPQTITIS
jgi:HSP20 family protein